MRADSDSTVVVGHVGWYRRGLIVLALISSALGAFAWWRSSDESSGFTALLIMMVGMTSVPIFFTREPRFRQICGVVSGILLVACFIVIYYFLIWGLLGAIVLLITGSYDRFRDIRMRRLFGGVSLFVALADLIISAGAAVQVLMHG